MTCFATITRNISDAMFNRKFHTKRQVVNHLVNFVFVLMLYKSDWCYASYLVISKLLINRMLARVKIIKGKRALVSKSLRNKACELLEIGQSCDAFALVKDIHHHDDRTLCYDYIDNFCTLILDHLTPMTNQRECPEKCKEAVASLMYATRRFGDLIELYELENLFYKKYWTSVESFVNKEFLALLESDRPPAHETAVNRLLQEIAQENGLEWCPKSFDNGSYSDAEVTYIIDYEVFSFMLDASTGDVQDKEHMVKQTEDWLRNIGLLSPKHVHPKLPNYDVFKTQLQLRRESFISAKNSTKSRSLHKHVGIIKKQHVAPTLSHPVKTKQQLRRHWR